MIWPTKWKLPPLALFTSRETVIYANAFWAGIDIIVDATRRIRSGEGSLYIVGAFESASMSIQGGAGRWSW